MITKHIKFGSISSETIPFGGGLNEQVTNAELKRGELISCLNYLEQYGTYHGYSSIQGYERFDGNDSPSEIALDDPETLDDTSREAARAAISAVPGTGNITGVHIYNDKVYAFRNDTGPTNGAMYESSTSGWVEVDTNSNIELSGQVRAINGRFSLYNSNEECMFWVDGVSPVLTYDGNSVTTITPDGSITDKATHIGVWKNRLFVVYPNGHILFSKVGDPTDFDNTSGFAGEIYLGSDVTNVREAPGGTLIFTTRKSVHVLQYGSTSDEFIFKLDAFSSTTGAFSDTATDLMGTVYYVDDQGLTSLEAVSTFGDFEAKAVGQKVNKTFIQNKSTVTFGFVDRNTNRYYLLYNDTRSDKTRGLVFTFKDKFVKGATKIILKHKVTAIVEGSMNDGTNRVFFGSDNGFVYEMFKGTSFDGDYIDTRLTTSFYSYGSYRVWKSFRRMLFELTADHGTVMEVFADYDYGSRKLNKANTIVEDIDGSGGIWGQSVWGQFIWSARVLSNAILYSIGLGSNMSITVKTREKYRNPHTIHNVTVDFLLNGVQM